MKTIKVRLFNSKQKRKELEMLGFATFVSDTVYDYAKMWKSNPSKVEVNWITLICRENLPSSPKVE